MILGVINNSAAKREREREGSTFQKLALPFYKALFFTEDFFLGTFESENEREKERERVRERDAATCGESISTVEN